MKQLREHWSWSSAAAPIAFGLVLTTVITSCGKASNPVGPSAGGASLVASETAEPSPTPVPTPDPEPDPTPEPTPEPTPTPTPPGGGEGCTPGYWKQTQHYDSWVGYSPNQAFSSVFENAFPGMTLVQVLSNGGGGLDALGRHTVAALLNASSPDVDSGLSAADVISAFNAAYPGGDYEALKNRFAGLNEQGCPIN